MGSMRDIILAENDFIWNGGSGSGWFSPPKGTHVSEEFVANLQIDERYGKTSENGWNKDGTTKEGLKKSFDSKEKSYFRGDTTLEAVLSLKNGGFEPSDNNVLGPHITMSNKKEVAKEYGKHISTLQISSDAKIVTEKQIQNMKSQIQKMGSATKLSSEKGQKLVRLYNMKDWQLAATFGYDGISKKWQGHSYIRGSKEVSIWNLNKVSMSPVTEHYYNQVLDKVLNAWDESKHPRDKKGRFTYIVKFASMLSKSPIGGDVISEDTIQSLRNTLDNYAKQSPDNAKTVDLEREDNVYYQSRGYKYINDELRSGGSLDSVMCENLDNSCRFSSDKPFQVYRGESSFSNNWSGVKVGDSIPDGLAKSFISTSTDKNVADKFATHDRMGLGAKIYETTITINVPTTQRFGIPNVYDKNAVAKGESEVLLPYGTKGKVSKITETTKKVGKDTIIQQVVTIDL